MKGIDNVMNLGEMLNQIARRYPDAPGFIRGGREYTWKEISMRVDSVAAALRDRGIGKGDKLLVHSRNNLPLFESAWVAFRLGAVWVPTNVRITPVEAAYLGSSSGAVAMLYDEGLEHYVDAVREASPSLQTVIAIGQPRSGELGYEQLLDEGRASYAAFRAAEVTYHDPLWFFYTSGTTGHPKAGVLTHGQMAFVITNHIADLMPGLNQHSRSLVLAPLSHGAGIHALVNVARGAACVLPASDKLDCDEAWRLVQEYRVDNLFTVPNRFWSVGPQLAMTLFDGGQRSAEVDRSEAAYDETVAKYRQTVLDGFREVENYLVQLKVYQDEAAVRQEALDAARDSLRLTENQYKAGLIAYIDVVVVQATALSNERSVLNILQSRLIASVQLIAALGGGWDGQLDVSDSK